MEMIFTELGGGFVVPTLRPYFLGTLDIRYDRQQFPSPASRNRTMKSGLGCGATSGLPAGSQYILSRIRRIMPRLSSVVA